MYVCYNPYLNYIKNIRSYEDYDWAQDCMVKYRRNDNGGFDRF